MSIPIQPPQVTVYSGIRSAGNQPQLGNFSLAKAVTALVKNLSVNNLSVLPSSATGAPLTIVGYTPTAFSGSSLLGSFFFSLAPTSAAGNTGVASNTGILTLPQGAKITSVQLATYGSTGLGSGGSSTINIGYQATASAAVAGSASQLLASSAYSLLPTNSSYINLMPIANIGAALSATNVGGNPLSAQQTLNITVGTAALTAGALQILVSYYL